MKAIAIEYFKWGWIVTSAVMAWVGFHAEKHKRWNLLLWACVGSVALGALMLWVKYS